MNYTSPSIEDSKKCKVSFFIDTIWGANLAGMQLRNKYNKEILFLCFINVFKKYGWAIPSKDKKVKQSVKHHKHSCKSQTLNQKRYWQIIEIKF